MWPRWKSFSLFIVPSMLLLALPALYNGWPLLFPDSLDYLLSGNNILLKLLSGEEQDFYGTRSKWFGLSLLPLHRQVSPWPLLLLSGGVVSLTLWFALESLKPGSGWRERLLITMGLVVATPLAWHTSRILPDYLTGVMVLWIVLLAFPERLSWGGLIVGAVLLWYATVAHTSHLGLGAVLLLCLLTLHKKRARVPLLVFGVVLLSQIAMHFLLYQKPAVLGPHPPFLMARVIADGPGRLYMKETDRFAVCAYAHLVETASAIHILWDEQGLFSVVEETSSEDWKRLKEEELSFVLSAIAAHPALQLKASLGNFLRQFGWWGLTAVEDHPFIRSTLGKTFPNTFEAYDHTVQAGGALPLTWWARLHSLVTWAALLYGVLVAARGHTRLSPEFRCLTVLVLLSLAANAAITGVLSIPEARYQSRISWLVPFWAWLLHAHLTRSEAQSIQDETEHEPKQEGSREKPSFFDNSKPKAPPTS